jgi:hypothetical protein
MNDKASESMKCNNCNTENHEGAAFCTECGIVLDAGDDSLVKMTREADSALPFASEVQGPSGSAPDGSVLVPRNLRELVSESVVLYRKNFWVFFRIALLASIPLIISNIVRDDALVVALSLVNGLTTLLAVSAATYMVALMYAGEGATAAAAYVAALNKGITLLIPYLLFMLGAFLLILTVLGIPLFIYFAIALVFFPQVILIEGAGSLEALRRSRELVQRSWWRVFGICIVYICLGFAGSLAMATPGLLLETYNETLGSLSVTLGTVVILPFFYIGQALVYFDLRVRKEGYTVERMADELRFESNGMSR